MSDPLYLIAAYSTVSAVFILVIMGDYLWDKAEDITEGLE